MPNEDDGLVRSEVSRLDERINAIHMVLSEREKATSLQARTQANINAAQNEFRQTLSDQAKTFISRPEHEGLERRLSAIERTYERFVGSNAKEGTEKRNAGVLVAIVLSALAVLVQLAGAVFYLIKFVASK